MWELYWITRICALNYWSNIILALSGFSIVIAGFVIIFDYDYFKEHTINFLKRIVKISACIFIISAIINAFIPSKKEMLIIVGGGAIYDYVQSSDEMKKLPDNVVKAINDWLTEEENDKTTSN